MIRCGFVAMLALAGCGGPKVPPLTPAEGVVEINGQPLPNAQVTLTPSGSGLPADAIATGTTDEKGHFQLTTGGKPGAVPGEHIVTVTEGPTPEGLRDADAQGKLASFQASLKNRPIPPKYATTTKSDVKLTIAKEQKDYKVELKR